MYWENLSRNEIAEVLGVSIIAVNVRHHRALGERCGRDIFRVVHVRSHSLSVVVDTVAVQIEDGGEGIAVIAKRRRPGRRLVRIRSHHR